MDLGLKDKVALVVASSSGLGFAAAQALAQEGAKVMISGRSQERLDEALAQMATAVPSATVAATVVNVLEAADIERLVAATVARFGGLDILITNAGGPPSGTFDSVSVEQWATAVNLTLMSVVHLVKAALPALRQSQSASILTITSISAKQPIAGLLTSNVLRPAVVGLTKTLSQELGPEGIRVNSILPGWTSTERVNELLTYRADKNQSTADTESQKITQSTPLGRMATPDEFAKVATFMVSPAASYLTGVMLQVDGGSYAGLL